MRRQTTTREPRSRFPSCHPLCPLAEHAAFARTDPLPTAHPGGHLLLALGRAGRTGPSGTPCLPRWRASLRCRRTPHLRLLGGPLYRPSRSGGRGPALREATEMPADRPYSYSPPPRDAPRVESTPPAPSPAGTGLIAAPRHRPVYWRSHSGAAWPGPRRAQAREQEQLRIRLGKGRARLPVGGFRRSDDPLGAAGAALDPKQVPLVPRRSSHDLRIAWRPCTFELLSWMWLRSRLLRMRSWQAPSRRTRDRQPLKSARGRTPRRTGNASVLARHVRHRSRLASCAPPWPPFWH